MSSDILYDSPSLSAYHHPKPAYALHILILPKRNITNLQEFVPADHQEFLVELFTATKRMVERFNLDSCGYRLIVNGGKYQQIPQLHFHLVSDDYEGKLKQI